MIERLQPPPPQIACKSPHDFDISGAAPALHRTFSPLSDQKSENEKTPLI
jgi:hypothetical protein